MKLQKKLLKVTFILGLVSFFILIFYFLALTDIWHENGRKEKRWNNPSHELAANLVDISVMLRFFGSRGM